jgi:hypothetical protein
MIAAAHQIGLATVRAYALDLGHPDEETLRRRCRSEITDLEQLVVRASTSPFGTTRFPQHEHTAGRAPGRVQHETLTEARQQEAGCSPIPAQPSPATAADTTSPTMTSTPAAAAMTSPASSPDALMPDTTATAAGDPTQAPQASAPVPDLNPIDQAIARLATAGKTRPALAAIAELAVRLAARAEPEQVLRELDAEVMKGRRADPDLRRLMAALLPVARFHEKREQAATTLGEEAVPR